MMDKLICKGIVLRSTPYGEADIIGTLLTESNGLLSFVAHNAKKSKRRLGGSIEVMDAGIVELCPPRKLEGLHEISSINSRQVWHRMHTSTALLKATWGTGENPFFTQKFTRWCLIPNSLYSS